MMPGGAALRRLEALRNDFGPGRGAEKLELLRALERAPLRSRRAVLRLHEQLCFIRAYPDDEKVLAQLQLMLSRFHRRGDLRRRRADLADTGIAGTDIHYRFFWPTARWLSVRWPALFHVDWNALDEPERLSAALPLMATPIEAEWLRNTHPAPRAALGRLVPKGASQAAFLIRRIAAMPGSDATRESYCDTLDVPFVLRPGPDTPSRTRAEYARAPVAFVRQPLRRERPDLDAELKRPPRSVRAASPTEAHRLIDLAHEAMVTHARDLDAFSYGNPRDVWIVDDGEGLQWALVGMIPERRLLLRAAYGFLTLRNGVPTGYGQLDALCHTVDIAFNSFATFRGAEVARIFVRLLAASRAVLGAAAFTLEPYQLGHHNAEGIASGAWWFYYKLGFRPRDPAIRALAEAELERMRADPGHRSPVATLKQLAADYLFFETEGVRAPYWPRLADVGARAAERLAALDGLDREAAVRQCVDDARRRLGLRDLPSGTRDMRLAWERWSPIVALLPVERWSRSERQALAAVINAKGGPSDRDFVNRFDAHPRLASALRALIHA